MEYRLTPFALNVWLARRAKNADKFPYPLLNAKRDFAHYMRQWRRLGEAVGKGNRAARRIRAINKANGPWLNWPDMTITSE